MSEESTKKEYKRKRDNQIIIRFSDEELGELNEAIIESGLNKTEFFLELLRKGNIIIMNDLKEVCVELKRQGINLNQALKYYHETQFTEEIKKAIYNCNEVYEIAKNIFLAADKKMEKGKKKKEALQQKKENKTAVANETAGVEEIGISENIAIAKQIEKYQAEKEKEAGEK